MRTIKFSLEERKTLKEIIDLGESQYQNYFGETSKTILNKLRIEIFHFDKKEILLLKSYTSNWINNYEEKIEELRIKFLINKVDNISSITQSERELMSNTSKVFDIKSKLFKEQYITFKEVLDSVKD